MPTLTTRNSIHFRTLTGIIKGIEKTLLLDKVYGCEEVYHALGAGAAITLFTSFFPGAGTAGSLASRSAYYGVRTANAFYNLASRLKKSKNTVWQVATAVYKIQKLAKLSVKFTLKVSHIFNI